MSYNFGSTTTTAGSTFGTATPSTGFAFGSGDAAKQGLFGSNTPENKPAYNFSSPSGGSFAFGAATTTAQPTSSLFATPATTNATSAFGASKPMGFGGFSSPPNQTVGSPGFGQPATQNALSIMPFGGANQQIQPAPAFGTPPAQAPSAGFGASPGSGFGFATPASGFSSAPQASTQQPAAAATAPQPSSLLGSPAGFPPAFGAKPGSAFSFSSGNTAPPAFSAATAGVPPARPSFALPGQQQQPTPQIALSFGTTTSAAPTGLTTGQPTGLSSGLNFGGAQQTPASTTPAFGTTTSSFQAPAAQQNRLSFGSPATSTPAAPGAGLNFGTTTSINLPQTGPNFGTAPVSTAQPTTGLSFGTPATTSQPSGLNFGSSGPIVSGAPTSGILGTSTANQPSTGPSFGTTSAAPSGLSFGTTTTAPGLSFGAPVSAAQTMQAAVSAPSSTVATTVLTPWSTASGQSTAQPQGLGFGTSTVTAPVTGLSFGTSTASTMQAGFGLSTSLKPTTSIAASSAASTTAPSGIIALGKTTAATSMASLTTATTTTASAPPQPQLVTSITFAQLEENINKWTLELEEQEITFINQATQINAWDRLLIANGEKIVELNDAVQSVKNEQQSLEHELDFVLAQQKELEDLLAPMEKQLSEETMERLRDPEREHMYTLAENLDTQLRQMSEDLKEVIEHLNETNRSQDSNDPIVQIGRILNAHMSSMQWIDNSIAQISTKLDQLKATHDTLRRDNERSYQLTYN